MSLSSAIAPTLDGLGMRRMARDMLGQLTGSRFQRLQKHPDSAVERTMLFRARRGEMIQTRYRNRSTAREYR